MVHLLLCVLFSQIWDSISANFFCVFAIPLNEVSSILLTPRRIGWFSPGIGFYFSWILPYVWWCIWGLIRRYLPWLFAISVRATSLRSQVELFFGGEFLFCSVYIPNLCEGYKIHPINCVFRRCVCDLCKQEIWIFVVWVDFHFFGTDAIFFLVVAVMHQVAGLLSVLRLRYVQCWYERSSWLSGFSLFCATREFKQFF